MDARNKVMLEEQWQKIGKPCAVRLIEELLDDNGATFGFFTCDTHRVNFSSTEEQPTCPVSRRYVEEAKCG